VPLDENGQYVKDDQGRLVVPLTGALTPTAGCTSGTTDIVQRRNFILELLRTDPTRRVLTGNTSSDADFVAFTAYYHDAVVLELPTLKLEGRQAIVDFYTGIVRPHPRDPDRAPADRRRRAAFAPTSPPPSPALRTPPTSRRCPSGRGRC